MKRLTERDEFGNADIIGYPTSYWCEDMSQELLNTITDTLNRLAAYEDTGLEPDEIKLLKSRKEFEPLKNITQIYGISLTRLAELAEAEKDGRLNVFKCNLGDKLFFKTWIKNGRECIGIKPHTVKEIRTTYITEGAEIPDWEIGKTVFLTREEAEKALKEREQK